MAGYTSIQLSDTSQENIDIQNVRLEIHGVPKKYRFYSNKNIIHEYEYFKVGLGVFPKDQFPKEKINSLDDFKKYWNTQKLSVLFCPPIGTINFDCYFGRTSKRAMRNIGKYLTENIEHIDSVGGSFSTFIERGMTKSEQKLMKEKGFVTE